MSGYTGMSGKDLTDKMRMAMTQAVLKTAKRIEINAKKKAPVRKVFQEKGAARMEERTFIDTGLPKNLLKPGQRAPKRKVVTVTVRTHRANRASTSIKARQNFRIVSHAEAHHRRLVGGSGEFSGTIIHTLKPNVVEVNLPKKDAEPVYAMFDGQPTSRGRYEVAKALGAYAASLEEGANVTPKSRTIREPYQPGKPGANRHQPYYPKGTVVRRKADGTLEASFQRVTMRQTIIRVRAEKSIRNIVMTAGKLQRKRALPKWKTRNKTVAKTKANPKGLPMYRSKPTKANPKGVLMNAGDYDRPHKATPHQAKKWEDYQAKVKEAKKARALHDDFGGLHSRQRAAQLSPFGGPEEVIGGAKFQKHFLLQVGGHLRDSIKMNEETAGDKILVTVGTDVYYAVYQEFGTSHHPAQPFLRPALYENRDMFLQVAKDKAGRALKGARRKG